MTKFTDTALTPALTAKLAAELADGSKGHVLISALRDLLRQQGQWRVLAASGIAVPLTGSTSEVAQATIAIPAGAMGPNGALRVTALWTYASSAVTKTCRFRLGGISGTGFLGAVNTTTTILAAQRIIQNANSEAVQIGNQASNATSYSTGSGSAATGAIDTSVAQDLVISGQLSDGSETLTLRQYMVEVAYGA